MNIPLKRDVVLAFFAVCIVTSLLAQNDPCAGARKQGLYGYLFAQANPCAEALKEGVYNYYQANTKISKYSSTKDYFKSDDFRTDAKSGSFGAGITLPIGDVPVLFNASTTDDKFTQLKQSIEKLSETQLNEIFVSLIKKSEPNVPFVTEYFKCVIRIYGLGFNPSSETIGDRVFFTVRFQPTSASNKMPTMQEDAKLFNSKEASGLPKKGKTLDFVTVVSAAPINSEMPVTLQMDTTQGPVYAGSEVREVTKKASSRIVAHIFREPSDNHYDEPMTGTNIYIARQQTERHSKEDRDAAGHWINYSFEILCYDQQGNLVGAGGLNDDSKWPAGCVLPQ